jgi:phytol kinase
METQSRGNGPRLHPRYPDGLQAKLLITFFAENLPALIDIAVWGPPSLAWACGCLFVAGKLKRDQGLQTGYTRKIFHFMILISAAGIQLLCGLGTLFIFGAATSLIVFYAIYCGGGHVLYEGIARETDRPWRTYYIIAPYFATLLGGIASNVLFGSAAVVGYLVTGFGDGVGELVGTRFGRHSYRVPSFSQVKATRSYEGSAAVFVVSIFAILVGILALPDMELGSQSAVRIVTVAASCALVEALSPHGWDNATMQIIPSFLAWSLL